MTHEEVAHLAHRARGALLPRPAEAALPLPDEGARRAAPARGPAAHARVHHEGRLLVRPRPARGSSASYQLHIEAYDRIFDRTGLEWYRVESDVGMMGGFGAHEYMAPCAAGRERRRALRRGLRRERGDRERRAAAGRGPARARAPQPKEVDTPGATTIEAVSEQLGVPPGALIKAFPVFAEERGPLLVVIRGDHRLNEIKLQNALGAPFRAAEAEEVREAFGAEPGFIGPVGAPVPVLADEALRGLARPGGGRQPARRAPHAASSRAATSSPSGSTCGAWRPGDRDPSGAPIRIEPAIEVGNIFKLGTRYSEPLGARYLDEEGQEQLIWMGSYGIGPARIVAAAIEQFADEQGISWPRAVAPFDVELVTLGKPGEEARSLSEAPLRRAPRARAGRALRRPRRREPGPEVRRRRAARLPAARDDRQEERRGAARSSSRSGAGRRRARCRSRARPRRRRSCGGPSPDLPAAGRARPLRRRRRRRRAAGSRSTRGRSPTRSASRGSRWSRSSSSSA